MCATLRTALAAASSRFPCVRRSWLACGWGRCDGVPTGCSGCLVPGAHRLGSAGAQARRRRGCQEQKSSTRLGMDPTTFNAARNRELHKLHAYGNYHSVSPPCAQPSSSPDYYAHRTECVPDARLSALPLQLDLFLNKHVLDLGCNAGKISLEVKRYLHAASVVGIDIDATLISDATALGDKAAELSPDHRCEFVVGDFMAPGYFEDVYLRDRTGEEHAMTGEDRGKGRARPDTILLLSITKWLHLHHGDAGLLALFHSLYNLLAPGGILVVEPQEWKNYKSAVKKNRDLRDVFKGIQIRPNFEAELRDVGFVMVEGGFIERDEGGFSRPLMIWRK